MSQRRSHFVVVFWTVLAIVGFGQTLHRLTEHAHPPHAAVSAVTASDHDSYGLTACGHGCGHVHTKAKFEGDLPDNEPEDSPEDEPCDHSDCELCLMLGSLVSPVPTAVAVVAIDGTTFEYLHEDRSVAIVHRRIASAPTRGPPAA